MKSPRPRLAAAIAVAALLGACACFEEGTEVEPILDGAPSASFRADLASCRALARDQRQLDRATGGAALIGAGMGGVIGAASDGDNALGSAAVGAAFGALVGAVAGVSDATDRREAIVKECLRGRGHLVVG